MIENAMDEILPLAIESLGETKDRSDNAMEPLSKAILTQISGQVDMMEGVSRQEALVAG
jgi:hypothetical protein